MSFYKVEIDSKNYLRENDFVAPVSLLKYL